MKRGTVVPAFLDGGQWSASFGISWSNLLLRDLASEGPIFGAGTYLREQCGTGGIADGRNRLCEGFLATEGEWLWMVDTDMGFADDVVDRLVAAADRYDRPVVGGLAFAQRRLREKERPDLQAERFGIIPTIYQWRVLEDEAGFQAVRSYPRDSLVKTAGTGGACLLIHRRVVEKVHGKFPWSWFSLLTLPGALKGRPRTFSEDLSFCVRLAELDIPLHVHTGIQTSHEKGGIFLTEEEFDRQQAAEPAEPEVPESSSAA